MDATSSKKYRNIGLLAITMLAILIILFGERARHDEKVAEQKAANAAAEKVKMTASAIPETPTAAIKATPIAEPDSAGAEAKDNTDEQINVSGLAADEAKQALSETSRDKPSSAAEQDFPRFSQQFNPENIDQINSGLKQAIKLQESDPGRYTTAPLTPGGNLYGLDSANGIVAVLVKGATKWHKVGRPGNAAPASNGTYMITHADDAGVTIMNTNTTFTWRAELKDGKWQWEEIGGFPDDSWLHN